MTRVWLVLIGLLMVVSTVCQAEASTTPWPGVISDTQVNFRAAPAATAKVITTLANGSPVTVLEFQKPWYKVRLADGRQGWVHQAFVAPSVADDSSRMRRTMEIVSRARRFMGTQYVYGGGSGSGFDCSGFTMYVYRQLGVQLPHNAAAQMDYGTPVKRAELIPGDLVFFATMGSRIVNHVGIYIGNDQFIHASSGYGAVRVSELSEDYYSTRYRGARRLINNTVTDGVNEAS